jgi:serine/threonine protein kinase
MKLINNKYKIFDKIGSGSFGSVYKAQNVRTEEFVAIKIEKIDDNIKLLKNESKIYHYLNKSEYVPCVKWFGKDDVNYYMVINLLGSSLQNLLNKSKNKKFTLMLTLKIGIKIIDILKSIHEKGLIHRDIKPANFLFGLHDINKIYLIDFGFCKTYIENGEHNKVKKMHNMIGSKNYASITSHKHYELSRRDDLESLAYMLLYFYTGILPWTTILIEEEIISLKRDMIYNKTYPSILLDLLKYSRILEYEETPNYNVIIENFKKEIEIL